MHFFKEVSSFMEPVRQNPLHNMNENEVDCSKNDKSDIIGLEAVNCEAYKIRSLLPDVSKICYLSINNIKYFVSINFLLSHFPVH